MNRLIRKCFPKLLFLLVCMLWQYSTYAQAGITFTFANPTLTNTSGIDYFEFDILAATTESSQFGIAQIYIDYNTLGFGSSLVANGKVSITEGELLNDVIVGTLLNGGYGDYSATVVDNTALILAIQNDYTRSLFGSYPGRSYELTNTLGTTPKVYVHVKMEIWDQTEYSEISFNTQISQWDIQDYYYTTPFTDILTIYVPVVETATLNLPLGSPVPVELVSFNAKVNDRNVILNWITATEVNNYGFEIDRKTQDARNEVWEKIGYIHGNGNSNSPKEYSYTDVDVQSGKYSYRLKQIDNDGQFEYSPEVSVEISVPNDYTLEQNFPNPFNPSTTIRFTIPEDGLVKLSVYNLLGQEVRILVEEPRQAGSYIESFDAFEINSGVYFYELKVNDFVQTKKMQFLK